MTCRSLLPVALLAALLAEAEQEVFYVPGKVVNRGITADGIQVQACPLWLHKGPFRPARLLPRSTEVRLAGSQFGSDAHPISIPVLPGGVSVVHPAQPRREATPVEEVLGRVGTPEHHLAPTRGELVGTFVTCPRHHSHFDLTDGHLAGWAGRHGLGSPPAY